MIWEVRQRSVLHLAQCKREEWPLRNLSSGGMTIEEAEEAGTGVGERVNGFEEMELDVDARELVDSIESVEDCRDLRRKGTDGRRYVGKMLGYAWGSLGLRKSAMVSI